MTLRADTKEQKCVVQSIVGLYDTCCYFPLNYSDEDNDYPEYDDRIYIDGIITFDKMAEIVDFLRACNLEKK